MSEQVLRSGFSAAGLPQELVDALLVAFKEAKRKFHLGDHRPSAVEGGRFCEAVFRLLQHSQRGSYAPLGDPKFNTNSVAQTLEADTALDDTVRFHLPRALRVIYDIRNKRDTGHLGNGAVSPNLMDSTLVVNVMDWIMAELVRLFHNVPVDDAQAIIDGLVTREVPVVEEIAGFPVVSKNIRLGDHILVLLYRAGRDSGLSIRELMRQLRSDHRGNLVRAIRTLEHRKLAFLDVGLDNAHITTPGIVYLEASGVLTPSG